MEGRILRTDFYEDQLHANRERGYCVVLNPENVLEVLKTYTKMGKWSHNNLAFFYRPLLYVLAYYHSTHPVPGIFWIDRWDEEGKKKRIYEIETDADYIALDKIPVEVREYTETILRFIREHAPELYWRSVRLGVLGEKQAEIERKDREAEIQKKIEELFPFRAVYFRSNEELHEIIEKAREIGIPRESMEVCPEFIDSDGRALSGYVIFKA